MSSSPRVLNCPNAACRAPLPLNPEKAQDLLICPMCQTTIAAPPETEPGVTGFAAEGDRRLLQGGWRRSAVGASILALVALILAPVYAVLAALNVGESPVAGLICGIVVGIAVAYLLLAVAMATQHCRGYAEGFARCFSLDFYSKKGEPIGGVFVAVGLAGVVAVSLFSCLWLVGARESVMSRLVGGAILAVLAALSMGVVAIVVPVVMAFGDVVDWLLRSRRKRGP